MFNESMAGCANTKPLVHKLSGPINANHAAIHARNLSCMVVMVAGVILAKLTFASSIVVDQNTLINVQLGVSAPSIISPTAQYAGPAVVTNGSTNFWNQVLGPFTYSGSTGTGIPLLNSVGSPTGATLSYSTPGGFYNAGSFGIFNGTPQQNLMTSYLYADTSGAGAGTVKIGGLTPNAYYELLPYSAADYVGRGTTFTVGGVQSTVSPTATPTLTLNNSFAEFISKADGSGNLNIKMASNGTSTFPEANLNGLQIMAIPQVLSNGLINVQFGEHDSFSTTTQYNGPGVVSGTAGNDWNLISGSFDPSGVSGNDIALNNANGTASGVALSYSALGFYDSGTSGIFSGTPEDNLLTSYVYADTGGTGDPGTFTFSGLTPGNNYELIFDSVANSIGRGTLFSVDGMNQIVSSIGIPTQGLGDSYAEFFVTADMAGDINFSMSGFGTGGVYGFPEANLNGIQLIALSNTVPEPPSLLVILSGLMALGWTRRRCIASRKSTGPCCRVNARPCAPSPLFPRP